MLKPIENTRTPAFLMANLGAEVSRIFSYKEKGDVINIQKASSRAREIVSQIFQFDEMKARRNEIEKIADVIDSVLSNNGLEISKKDIENYFNSLAIRLITIQQ